MAAKKRDDCRLPAGGRNDVAVTGRR